MARGPNGNGVAVADYLGGDPAEPESITGGRLDLDGARLRFTGPGGRGLELGPDTMLGISISGRSADRGRGRKGIHGTMRVAGVSHGEPAEWVFAIDRSAAARLQAQLNQELANRGMDALPHVEELVGFPLHNGAATARVASGPPAMDLVAAELGHRLAAADRKPPKSRRRKWLPWVALGLVLVLAEVAVPLLLMHGG
jgi:hypothetical protein